MLVLDEHVALELRRDNANGRICNVVKSEIHTASFSLPDIGIGRQNLSDQMVIRIAHDFIAVGWHVLRVAVAQNEAGWQGADLILDLGGIVIDGQV